MNPSDSNALTRRRLLALAGTGLVASTARGALPSAMNSLTTFALSDLDLGLADQGWNIAQTDQSMGKKPLLIAGRGFARGVGTHAPSRIVVHLGRKSRRFRALVGVDDAAGAKASVRFVVRGDGRELFASTVMKKGAEAAPLDLDVSGVDWLTLHAEDGGDGTTDDFANWAEATFEGVTQRPRIFARLPEENELYLPGKLWTDASGARIQAHGGGFLRHGGKWWWHGENRANGYIGIGVSAYSSSDLQAWKHEGLVLPRALYNEKHGDQTICERPKVVYNPKTGKFVMWFHYDRSGYGDSRAGVALADRPEGPFRFLGAHRPIESSTYRDMNLWVDDDGAAYAFYAGEGNWTMHVVRLNDEWTGPQLPMVEGQTWSRILVRKMREAPAPFKHDGKYYLLTSGCTGWAPNPLELSVAPHPLGPYESLGDPCRGPEARTTFRSQPTFVLPMPGAPAGHFIYAGDRWKPESLADSRYVWLPFRLNGKDTVIEWKERWKSPFGA